MGHTSGPVAGVFMDGHVSSTKVRRGCFHRGTGPVSPSPAALRASNKRFCVARRKSHFHYPLSRACVAQRDLID